MIERTTVRLPAELLRRAKRKAADEGRTLTSLIEDGLRQVVSNGGPKTKRPRGPVPVSKAKGDTWPGIDISDSAALQEREDLEYVERMKRFK
jgi:hypothetical protein